MEDKKSGGARMPKSANQPKPGTQQKPGTPSKPGVAHPPKANPTGKEGERPCY